MPDLDVEAPDGGPVMTFRVGDTWLATPVTMMERIVQASRLVRVPLAVAQHAGLLEFGDDLVPVMSLASTRVTADPLVAVLHVRGERVGLCIDAPGRVHDALRPVTATGAPPAALANAGSWQSTGEQNVWLINPDRLWLDAAGDLQPSSIA